MGASRRRVAEPRACNYRGDNGMQPPRRGDAETAAENNTHRVSVPLLRPLRTRRPDGCICIGTGELKGPDRGGADAVTGPGALLHAQPGLPAATYSVWPAGARSEGRRA